jgi:hypothetical protein
MSPNGLHIQLLNCWFSQDLNLTILIIRPIGAFVGLCLIVPEKMANELVILY